MAGIYNSQLDAFDLYHEWSEEKRKSRSSGPDLPALGHATAGSIGASISNIFTYPLDLIITRLQIQRQLQSTSQSNNEEYKSILDAARKIYVQEGFAGFYTGVVQDTLKTAADSFLFFFLYNSLRDARLKARGRKHHLPVTDELAVGFLSGAASKFFTMPIGTIVTRLQTTSMVIDKSGRRKRASMADIAEEIREEKGIAGFWSGYSATLILTLNPTLTFFLFERLKTILVPRGKRQSPSPVVIFLLAATSKALASTITYPFSLAKARIQASRKAPTQPEISAPEKSADKSATSRHGRAAIQRTVIGTILEIIKNEGISALYQGLQGEVLKGFFSHGMTMFVKEAVHGLMLKIYFAILRLIKSFPSPDELATIAKDRASSAADYAQEVAQSAAERSQDALLHVSEQGKATAEKITKHSQHAAEYIAEKTQPATDYVTETAKPTAEYLSEKAAAEMEEFVKEYVGDGEE